jgi:hypothetical protein
LFLIFMSSDLGTKRMGKKLGIVGSRHFPHPEKVRSFVRSLPTDTVVVSGGATGVDQWAVETGAACGLQTVVYEADWKGLGRKAGPIRNAKIVENVEELAAFWDGRSRGTLNTIALAVRAGLTVKVFGAEGEALPLEWVLEQARQRGAIAAIEAVSGRQ